MRRLIYLRCRCYRWALQVALQLYVVPGTGRFGSEFALLIYQAMISWK
jgi:hypothetical protein